MTNGRQPLEIRPFASSDLDAAAGLLAERHRRHRRAEPLLDPAYEDPAAGRPEIESLWRTDKASGWVALTSGVVVGYLVGIAKSQLLWGPNVWVEAAGHAADDASVVRDLFAVAAEEWTGEGRANHHVLVPATDVELVEVVYARLRPAAPACRVRGANRRIRRRPALRAHRPAGRARRRPGARPARAGAARPPPPLAGVLAPRADA